MTNVSDLAKRRWELIVGVSSVVGAIIAILGFAGYPSYWSLVPQSLLDWFHTTQAPPPPIAHPTLAPSGTPVWRPFSDLSNQLWVLNYNGHDVQFDFRPDYTVALSDPIFGASGRWTPQGRNEVRIETTTRTIMGTFTTSGDGISAIVYRPDGPNQRPTPDTGNLMLRRIR